ncbi:MAG: Cysteine desulfurase NifS [Phycisphaerae bacterium]|nr:Cysteine desulfurase NifS [Phycisphaerae bacterium]
MDWTYLDNNATTSIDPQAVEAMMPYLTERYGNPSSVHDFGGQVRAAVEGARASVAAALGCDPSEIVFTSGGTESDNMAVRGLLAARDRGTQIVISAVEHSAVRDLADWLEKSGREVIRVPVDAAGRLNLAALEAAVAPDETALVSIMHANNETGVIFPAARIAELCRERGVPFHCDAVQSFGKLPLNVRELGADLVSISAHKFHGPKGVGALYVRRGTRFRPWLLGHQERRRRGGTENVPGIVGMGEAARLAIESIAVETGRVRELRDRLEAGLLAADPSARVNGGGEGCPRLPNTTNISFPGCQSEALLIGLSERGVAASSGAACSSGSLEASHVLRAMAVPAAAAQGALRLSLSRFTTDADIARALETIPAVVARLRALKV